MDITYRLEQKRNITGAFPGPAESYHLTAEVAETLGLYGRDG